MTDTLSVVLVDDHPAMRLGLRAILEQSFNVLADAQEPQEAVKKILAYRPDIALIDVHYGTRVMGPSIVKAVKEKEPGITCVAYTVSTTQDDVAAMIYAGADGYLTKAAEIGDLDELLIEAHEGKQPVSPEVAAYILEVDSELEKEAATPFDGLTPKEREVVQMIARGYTYRESATRLDMKVKTLETHMSNIFRKLGVATRHHLSTLAFKLGFVDLTDDDYEDGSTGG